jgi:hypothetical protein
MRKFHWYFDYFQDGFEKSPRLLLLYVLLRASLSLFNLLRQSYYYLEDGLEQGLLLLLCEFHVSLIVLLLLLTVTSLHDQKLENHLHNKINKMFWICRAGSFLLGT